VFFVVRATEDPEKVNGKKKKGTNARSGSTNKRERGIAIYSSFINT